MKKTILKVFYEKTIILVCILLFCFQLSLNAQLSADKTCKIMNDFTGVWKGASLSWDDKEPHPMVSVEFSDPVEWQFIPVAGKSKTYKIVNTYPGKWKGASLSWDDKEAHPMISLEFDDPVEWRLDPVEGKADKYKIVNTYAGKWAGASISWDGEKPHPMASLEFNDPVEWKIIEAKLVKTLVLIQIECIRPSLGTNTKFDNKISVSSAAMKAGAVIKDDGVRATMIIKTAPLIAKKQSYPIFESKELGNWINAEFDRSRGSDGLYIEINSQRVWPGADDDKDVNAKDIVPVNLIVGPIPGNYTVQLMEYDWASEDDYFGIFGIDINEKIDNKYYTFIYESPTEDAVYLLTFEIR